MAMKRAILCLVIMFCMIVGSCAPVLDRQFMDSGVREVSFAALRGSPDLYTGRVFILGGVIVRTKLTEEGSQVEAMHVPVDSYGEFESSGRSEGRFLAFMPKDVMVLDPVVYKKGQRITLAGRFIGTKTGKIDEMTYTYPVFQIAQIYLWPLKKKYDHPPHYYDPWFYPYPYYYRNPWWYYPRKHAPVPVHPPAPVRASPNPKHDKEHAREREQK